MAEIGVVDDGKTAGATNSLGSVDGGMPKADEPEFGVIDSPPPEKEPEPQKTAEELAAEELETKRLADEKAALETKEKEPKVDDETEAEIQSLRQITREQKRTLDNLAEKIEAQNKLLQEANLISPEDVEAQKQQDKLLAQRNESLGTILEVMRVSDKFADVDDVVSQQNFDEMVDAMATVVIRKEGGDFDTVVKELRQEIWSMGNPYKFMYEQIKAYHPKFSTPAATPPAKATEKTPEEKEKELLSARKIATSIHEVPGTDGNGTGQWSKSMIDDLSEDELGKVPSDIYNRYLLNELK